MTAFHRTLRAGESKIGLWVNLADPAALEISLSSGFDWVLHDGEHSPADHADVLRTLQIARGYPTSVIVRPPVGDPVRIKRLLDLGARSLLIPMVDTAEHAALLAASMEFPPRGIRGVSSQTRGGDWGRRPDYLATAREELTLIVQIESADGVRNAAEILAVGGVDAAFVGTADLAASLGHPGQSGHPEVAEAVATLVALARRAGTPLGTLTRDLSAARRYAEQGFAFIGIGTDTNLFATALADLRASADLGVPAPTGHPREGTDR